MMLDDSNEEKITQGSISNLWHEVREGGWLGPWRLGQQGGSLNAQQVLYSTYIHSTSESTIWEKEVQVLDG